MRIAVSCHRDQVARSFERATSFRIYTIEGARVTGYLTVPIEGYGDAALTGYLVGLKVDALICGSINGKAVSILGAAGIDLYVGVEGDADAAAETYGYAF